jgi:hypothetical protein
MSQPTIVASEQEEIYLQRKLKGYTKTELQALTSPKDIANLS